MKTIEHLLLLFLGAAVSVTADDGVGLFGFWRLRNTTDLIPQWLPGCFESNDFAGFYACLQDNAAATCFSTSSGGFATLVSCVSDASEFDFLDLSLITNPNASLIIAEAVRSFADAARDCLDPFVVCVNATIQERIQTVLEPTCLPSKLSNLSICAEQNRDLCRDDCAAAWANSTYANMNPWEDLEETQISTCAGIQTEVIDPSCEIVTCCEPCVAPYEELMECLTNEVLNYTTDVCDFQCTLPERRHRSLRRQIVPLVRSLEEGDVIDTDLLDCLQFAPGLTAKTAAELAARTQSFIPCLGSEFGALIENGDFVTGDDGSGGDDDDDDNDGSGNGTGGDGGSHVGDGDGSGHGSGGDGGSNAGDDDDDDDDDDDSGEGHMGDDHHHGDGYRKPRDFEFWQGTKQDDLVPEWLPRCFKDDVNFLGFYGCLQNNADSSCFGADSFQTMISCVTDTLTDTLVNASMVMAMDLSQDQQNRAAVMSAFSNATRTCLNPFVDCVNATIQERIKTVLEPSCLPRKLRSLTRCARQNHKTCKDTCAAAWSNHSEDLFMEDLNKTTVSTCGGIQTEIMDPSCEMAMCCEPCVAPYEELMECMVNEVLNVTSDMCDFQCAASSGRRRHRALRQEDSASQRSLEDDDDSTLDACLQYAPGLTGSDAAELAARVPNFIPCVNSGFVTVLAQEAANDTKDDTKDDGSPSLGVTAVQNSWTTALIMAGSMWMCLFF